jgi:hypothetical protein
LRPAFSFVLYFLRAAPEFRNAENFPCAGSLCLTMWRNNPRAILHKLTGR